MIGKLFIAVIYLNRMIMRKCRLWVLRRKFGDIDWPNTLVVNKMVRIAASDGGRLVFSDNIVIDRFATVMVKFGELKIGCNSYVGIGSVLAARHRIEIGDHALIAEFVTIRDQDHDFDGASATAENGFRTAPIKIGDNVWIGAKATILRGVTIGSNVVIGANSVVTKDIPADSVAAGVPARVLRRLTLGA